MSRSVIVTIASILVFLGGMAMATIGNDTLGIDFGVFHAGGALIAESGFEAAYDPASFTERFTADYFPSLRGEETVSHFISPPPFGWLAQGLAVVPFDMALGLWLVAGALALVPALRLLGLPLGWVPVLLVSPSLVANTALGQTGPFTLLVFAAVHRLLESGRRFEAGLVAGVLVLKPTLALGFVLWWLLDARRAWPAMAGAILTSAVLTLPTIIGGLGPWRGFLEAMRNRVEIEGDWMQRSQSVPEFLKLLAPGSSGSLTLVWWAIGLATAGLVMHQAGRRWPDDIGVASGAAAVAAIWASPHLLLYDSIILLIPAAVAWQRGWLDRERAWLLAAIYTGSLAFGPLLYDVQFQVAGRGLGAEFLGLAATIVLLARWSAPVGADLGPVDRERDHLVVGQ